MGIFERMRKTTAGITNDEIEAASKSKAKHGDIIEGIITQLVHKTSSKKGGYGFISSEQLPYERIFFHWSGLKQDTLRFPDLKKRMKVELQLQHDSIQGYRAIKVKVLE